MTNILDNSYAKIPLGQRQFTIVDNNLHEYLSRFKWYLAGGDNHNTRYVSTHGKVINGIRKNIYMHRLVYELYNGEIPVNKEIDHLNGNRLDNRLSNLTCVTHRINTHNNKKRRNNNTQSKYVGVIKGYAMYNSYRATIKLNGTNIYLGTYETELQASDVYLDAMRMFDKGIPVHKIKYYFDNNPLRVSIHRRRYKKHHTKTSDFYGVYYYKQTNKWCSQITYNGRKINLGYHFSEEDAYTTTCCALKLLGLPLPINHERDYPKKLIIPAKTRAFVEKQLLKYGVDIIG